MVSLAAPFLAKYPSDAGGRRLLPKPPPKPVVVKKVAAPKPVPRVLPTSPAAAASSGNDMVSYFQSLFGTPLDAATLQAQALQSAKDQVAALVSPYLLQQQRAAERAAAQADLIRQGSAAVAQSLAPLGKQTEDTYHQALTDLQGFGQGYTGQLATDSAAEAAKNQATFDKLNMPATATNLGGNLGQVVYASGADVPASPLAAAGVAQTLAAQALPGQITAAGEQQVNLSNQQYATQQQDIGDQITAAYGQLPTLTQQFLTNYQDQQQKNFANQLNLLQADKPIQIGSAATGYQLIDPFTHQVVGTIPPVAGANMTSKVTVLKNGQVLTTVTNRVTGATTQKITGKAIPGLGPQPKTTTFSVGKGGRMSITTNPDGTYKTTWIRKPDNPVTGTVKVIGGLPYLITTNARTGAITQKLLKDLVQPIVQYHNLGRGGHIITSYDPRTGVMTVTDKDTGVPYPTDKFRNADGTYTLVGYDKNGKAFTLQAGVAKVVPPTIRMTPKIGGYDVIDTATGNRLKHVSGPLGVAATKPVIHFTPKRGGWDVIDANTGQLIYHQKGPPQSGTGSGASTSVAYGRVNTRVDKAVFHSPAKGFTLANPNGPKVQPGTQKSATPFTVAVQQALAVAPKGRDAALKTIGILTGKYQPLIDEMTSFLGENQILNLQQQVTSGRISRDQAAAQAYAWGIQYGFPNDLWQVMVGSAFHTNAFGTEGAFNNAASSKGQMPDTTHMPSFVDPGSAASWYINQVLGGVPTAQTTAATRGGGSYPFGTSNLGAGTLDSFLRNQGSPLAGMGAAFIEAGQKYNVDPALMIAISGAESGFGKKPRGSYNYWGIGPGMDFASPGDSINEFAKLLRSYMNKGRTTLAAIGKTWAPIGAKNDPHHLNENWVPNVQSILKSMGVTQTDAQTVSFTTEGKQTALTRGAVQLVKTYLGTPYVWGGENPGGFDCSGLIQWVWAQQGIPIERTTYAQWEQGHPVDKGNLMPGDAVFFTGSDPKGGKPGHVGMYIGGGRFIEAPHSGSLVRISNLSGRGDYVGARRFV